MKFLYQTAIVPAIRNIINGIDKSFQFRPTNDRQVLTLPNSIRLRAAALTKYLVSLFDIAAMLFRHILNLSLIDL